MDEIIGRQLKTVNTSIKVLQSLEQLNGAGVTELANYLDLSKGAVHNHLSTLRANKLIVKNGDEYHLALQFITFGEYVKNRSPLYRSGREEIDRIAIKTGEYAHLMAEEYGQGIHLYKDKGENAVGEPYHNRNLQEADHLHYSAAGKAILSSLQDGNVESIIEQFGLPKRTDNTITTPESLFEELEEIRDRGYAFNDEEEIEGLRAVGAPIHAKKGEIIGAVSISGPVSRLKGDRFRTEIPEVVVQAANVIELNIDTA